MARLLAWITFVILETLLAVTIFTGLLLAAPFVLILAMINMARGKKGVS